MAGDKLGASFRDPSGYMFRTKNGTLLRYVSKSYQADFDELTQSGLYDKLLAAGLLVKHVESKDTAHQDSNCYKIIKPDVIPFISYPYEWSFSQLKDAALATLKIQQLALDHGMTLKDASAYNMQFRDGKPVLIDTLSFEKYQAGSPWIAYRQFCQHFLAPLALANYTDIRLAKLMRDYIDGIPLDLASKLLPGRTKLKPQLAIHLHLHAKSQKKYADARKFKQPKVSLRSQKSLIQSLESVVKAFKWQPKGTEWGDYYTFTNYSSSAFKTKAKLVEQYIVAVKPKSVWDLGANNGEFTRIASARGIESVAFDIDPVAVEKNYLQIKAKAETKLLPLILDLTNPSPALGWANAERESVAERGPADLVMALALIHHLAISNNVPLENIAGYLSTLGKHLVIEFVPKTDSQVQKLLVSRKDIFPSYTKEGFEKAFSQHFTLTKQGSVTGSKRTLYLMKAK